MNWVIWLMIGLLVLSWAQYTFPDKVNFVGKAYDPINQQLKITKQGSTGGTVMPVSNCPDTYAPVCSGGQTYQNTCKAGEAGKLDVTPGACTTTGG